tara:strand:- start:1064 stop:1381 length:318 start_codon:yes stop_codon:yes gene_type:complete
MSPRKTSWMRCAVSINMDIDLLKKVERYKHGSGKDMNRSDAVNDLIRDGLRWKDRNRTLDEYLPLKESERIKLSIEMKSIKSEAKRSQELVRKLRERLEKYEEVH